MKYFLLLIAFVSSIEVSFAANCTQLWRNGFPDVVPSTTPVACDEFLPIHSTPSRDQKLFTVSSISSNPSIKEEMEIIADALVYSSSKFAMYGRVPAITVIRQDVGHPNSGGPNTMAFTYVQFFNSDTETCPIFVYPLSEILSKDHLKQLIAHEVFHCVQKVNFKEQVTHAVRDRSQNYWFEGLAQVFSNFVYPSNDFEYTFRFPAPDQTVPFFDQENAYSSENFWQSYSNLLPDSVFFNIMAQMPISDGEAPATTVLGLPRFTEALHKYAQQITLKQVRDSSGAWSPYDMPFESKTLTDVAHQEVRLPHADMTVGAYEIKIPKGGKWTLRFRSPDKTKISMKKAEDPVYAEVLDRPVVITSECDSERIIQIVLTTASDALAGNTTFLSVDKAANPDCECLGAGVPPQVDKCLIGTWKLDHTSVEQLFNRTNPNPMVRFNGSTGGFSVNFDELNIGTWVANSWIVGASASMPGMNMSLERITNGVSRFNYSANGSMACSKQISSTLTAKVITSMDGNVISSNDDPPMNFSNGVFTYSCSETQFIFKEFSINGSEMLIDYVFNRQ